MGFGALKDLSFIAGDANLSFVLFEFTKLFVS